MKLTNMHIRVLLALLPVENVGGVPGTVRAECQNMEDLERKIPGCRKAASELHAAGYVRTHTDYAGGWDWRITDKGKETLTGVRP